MQTIKKQYAIDAYCKRFNLEKKGRRYEFIRNLHRGLSGRARHRNTNPFGVGCAR